VEAAREASATARRNKLQEIQEGGRDCAKFRLFRAFQRRTMGPAVVFGE
jgi:hypothetical protein